MFKFFTQRVVTQHMVACCSYTTFVTETQQCSCQQCLYGDFMSPATIKHTSSLIRSPRFIFSDFNKFWFFSKYFNKSSPNQIAQKSVQREPSWCIRTDGQDRKGAFLPYAIAPKKGILTLTAVRYALHVLSLSKQLFSYKLISLSRQTFSL